MKLLGMTIKKRYIALGVIALELASIPVAAQIVDRVSFSVPQKVIAVPFPPEPGLTKFLVASNAPFAVVSENAVGEFDVKIDLSGVLNGGRYGANAQMPGVPTACAVQTSPSSTKIYEAERKTAAQEGDILTQAVIIEIRYDPQTTPDLKIVAENKTKRLPLATACAPSLS